LSNDGALSKYLRGLYGISTLTKEEESELSTRIQAGDPQALDKLVTHNLRFVVSVIKNMQSWQHSNVPMEDLLGFGNEALLTSAKRWVPKNNAKFATYAKKFIVRGVERGVANTANIIRIPVNVMEEVRRMKYCERILTQDLGRPPTTKEVSERLGIQPKRINQLKSLLMREPVSLDALNSEHLKDDHEE
jgi:DNA-directed RNA polymerase sigma subunit (sigma70/sigma32)